MTLKSPTAKPTAAEFGLLRAYLARAGISQAQIEQAISTAVNSRTRAQISAALKAWIAASRGAVPSGAVPSGAVPSGIAPGLRHTKG